ncbi:50S ribosomal protein L16 [Exaiptasia diaphana]|nr:50S ribosomal protein L16 [Exaiptasia diaphana]
MLPGGTVKGSTTPKVVKNNGVFELQSFGPSIVRMMSVQHQRYVAIAQDGRVHSTVNASSETILRQTYGHNSFDSFSSYIYRGKGQYSRWYLAIKQNGYVKNAGRVLRRHKSHQFQVVYLDEKNVKPSVDIPGPQCMTGKKKDGGRSLQKGYDGFTYSMSTSDFIVKSISMRPGLVKDNALESARLAIIRKAKTKQVNMIKAQIPVSKKALGSRMGKGKGKVDHYVANVKSGKLLFEYSCDSETLAHEAFRQASNRLPIKIHLRIKPSTGNKEIWTHF